MTVDELRRMSEEAAVNYFKVLEDLGKPTENFSESSRLQDRDSNLRPSE